MVASGAFANVFDVERVLALRDDDGAVFGDELMTSFLGATGVPKPLSVLTVASMGDEGYQVNYAGADAFSLTFAALRAQAGGGQAVPLVDDILRLPIGVVDARGRFVQWVMPR